MCSIKSYVSQVLKMCHPFKKLNFKKNGKPNAWLKSSNPNTHVFQKIFKKK